MGGVNELCIALLILNPAPFPTLDTRNSNTYVMGKFFLAYAELIPARANLLAGQQTMRRPVFVSK
jgi:hypothetical protein